LPDPEQHSNKEFKIIIALIRQTITEEDPQKWTKIAARLVGVSEETTTGVHRLK